MKLIDKDILVAEIDRRIRKYILAQQEPELSELQKEFQDKIDCLNSIKGYIINTLEVKEVNLEKEVENWIENNQDTNGFYNNVEFAKHFFELGLNANNNSVIEKACEWLKNNVTYTHPRTGETKCVVNLNAFRDAMKGE